MLDPDRGGVLPPLRSEADRLLFERLRRVVFLVLALLPLYVLADYYFEPPTAGLLQLEKLILCGICVLVWTVTRREALQPHARLIGIIVVAAIAATSAVSSNLTGQYATHAFLGVMMALVGATLAPWGATMQLLAVLIIAASVLWNVRVVTGGFSILLSYPSVAVAVTWIVSVYVAWLLEDSRRALALENSERERAQAALREEAATSAALAHVGEALIAAVNSPALLNRLSQLTMEMVGCDCSWTVLRKRHDDVYAIAGHAGFTEEQAVVLEWLTVPQMGLADFLERLGREEVVSLNTGDADPSPAARLAEQLGPTTRMHVALRRGEELIGYHAAGYRRPGAAFSSQQQRLLRGITHLASLALETARLVEELDRANRVKSDFVANMSHELRTPLHVILGYNELLFDGAFGPLMPGQLETIRRTDQRARELLDLINATLDLSRVDAALASLDARDVGIPELFEQLAQETRTMSGHGQVPCVWTASPDLPVIRTDPVKLRMVLKNLVQNALKFTPQGTVSVAAHSNGNGVEFTVTDTGIGIAKEEQARIFEPFVQVESGGGQASGGAGLGLHIVRRLLVLLGGRISLDSELGRGSVFRVWVPLALRSPTAADSARPAPLPADGDHGNL
jgi:signal transduction histidine kinase